MPLRGSPLSGAFGLEGGAPRGLAKPVPRVPWHGLLRGHSIDVGVAGSCGVDVVHRFGALR